MYIVELNLDGDVDDDASYHISTAEKTIRNNVIAALKKVKHNWVYLGSAETPGEAAQICLDWKEFFIEKLQIPQAIDEDEIEAEV